MPAYRLHYVNHEVELPLGEFTIGRGSKCQLILDDPQVSRRHASLFVTADSVILQDLGSRNATVVNGVLVKGKVTLIGGDRIQIGRHEIRLVRSKVTDTRDEVPTDGRAPAPWFHKSQLEAAATASAAAAPPPPPPPPAGPATARQKSDPPASGAPVTARRKSEPPVAEESTSPSSLLADLAQKALSAGNVEEAEWILGKILAEFHYRASGGDPPSPAQLEAVIGHALRLAQLTGKTIFLDGLFDVLGAAGYILDAHAVAELESLGRKIPGLAKGRLGKYVASLHGRPGTDGRLLARLEAICLPG